MTEHPTSVKQIVNAAVDATTGKSSALHHAAERVSELTEEGMEAIRDTSQEYKEQLMHASRSAISHIRHRPVQSVLIAALIGATAVTLMSLLRRRP